jgi:hypothetical protein
VVFAGYLWRKAAGALALSTQKPQKYAETAEETKRPFISFLRFLRHFCGFRVEAARADTASIPPTKKPPEGGFAGTAKRLTPSRRTPSR